MSEKGKKLRKARWTIRLAQYLPIYISHPEEYESLILNLECCDEAFRKKFILSHRLTTEGENWLYDNLYPPQPELFYEYVLKFGLNHDLQLKLIDNHDAKTINKLVLYSNTVKKSPAEYRAYALSYEAQAAIVAQRNPKFLEECFANYECIISPKVHDDVVKMHDIEMFKAFCQLNQVQNHDTWYGNEKLILEMLQKHDFEFIKEFLKHWYFSETTLRKIVQQIPQDAAFHRTVLTEVLNWQPFPVNILMLLVDNNEKELLKTHYEKYGIDERVLTHLTYLMNFKHYIGKD